MSTEGSVAGDIEQATTTVPPPDESRPIVSVNAGTPARIPWAYYVVVAATFVLVAAGTLYAMSRLKIRDAVAGQQMPARPAGTSIDPSASFASPLVGRIPEESVPPGSAPVASSELKPEEPCANRVVRDLQGSPILAPDGAPVMVTCDGRSVPRASMPTVTIGAATAGTPGVPGGALNAQAIQPPAPPDRYGGGVMIEPPSRSARPGEMPPETREALELLKRLENGPAASGTQAAASGSPSAPSASGAGSTQLDVSPDQDTPLAAFAAPGQGGLLGSSGDAARRETPRYKAATLKARRWTVPRGSHVECSLTLAYVSDIAGEAHCIVARDVFSHDAKTILINRGSIANGSFMAVTSMGDRRANVVWERLVTPAGVVVTLASRGTDALGSTGTPAEVDNRWMDRLGMAAAVSLVKDLTTAALARPASRNAAREFVSSSQYFADQVLYQTLAVRPSLYVKQGDAASIVLQADLDFSEVYGIRR